MRYRCPYEAPAVAAAYSDEIRHRFRFNGASVSDSNAPQFPVRFRNLLSTHVSARHLPRVVHCGGRASLATNATPSRWTVRVQRPRCVRLAGAVVIWSGGINVSNVAHSRRLIGDSPWLDPAMSRRSRRAAFRRANILATRLDASAIELIRAHLGLQDHAPALVARAGRSPRRIRRTSHSAHRGWRHRPAVTGGRTGHVATPPAFGQFYLDRPSTLRTPVMQRLPP